MINHDLHTHTPYSDGSHSVPLQILIARALELDAIAFTDHYFQGRGIGESDEAFAAYRREIEDSREGLDDLIVLTGAEAQALDVTGAVSIPAAAAEQLEWVLCDLGGLSEGTLRNTPASKQAYMDNVLRTYLNICELDFIDGIAHPFNTGNTAPALLPEEYPEARLRELAGKMAATRKVFDVMNLQVFWFRKAGVEPAELTRQYANLVRLFADAGVVFQVSSDDHRCGIGHTVWSQRVLATANVPPEQIVNPCELPRRQRR